MILKKECSMIAGYTVIRERIKQGWDIECIKMLVDIIDERIKAAEEEECVEAKLK